jgi:hypothetical protein
MLSAIIAAVEAKKKIRKSALESEVKARCLAEGETRGAGVGVQALAASMALMSTRL